ncbi:hypothetical protein HPB47_013036 [Ixodes persulcatus]|uniref:Uncharacterized protein n=1 Tax=Ixodes persulcatus TaxID=34615 RepID=A0AC60NRV1_IXOPE|nr:hypothetical protein HPB47_013036 [Ixodes persulcatus]
MLPRSQLWDTRIQAPGNSGRSNDGKYIQNKLDKGREKHCRDEVQKWRRRCGHIRKSRSRQHFAIRRDVKAVTDGAAKAERRAPHRRRTLSIRCIGALGNEALREYAAYINQLCGGESTPGTVYSKLCFTRSSVTSRIIGQYLPCTGGKTTCHLLQDLTIWNEFLMLLDVELKELTPRKLGVVSLGSSSRGEWRNSDHYHSFILLHWLLKEHHCIKTLQLQQAVDQENSQILFDALRLNSGLTRLNLNDCGWPGDSSMQLITAVLTMTQLEELELTKVNVTTEFVIGLHSKHSANAFECLYESETLALKVQDLTSETASEVQQRIRKTAAYLNVNFLAVVGVVADTVSCNRSDQSLAFLPLAAMNRETLISALQDDKALLEYAAHIEQLCPGMSTSQTIYAQLRDKKGSWSSRVMGRYLLCTDDGTNPCHLLQDLSIWNEFLRVLDVELKEVAPGRLGVVTLLGIYPWADWIDSDRQHPYILLHWLLREHHCIKTLEFKQAVIPGEPQLLCDALCASSQLTRFKLSDFGYLGVTSTQVVAALSAMTNLVELELTHVHVSRDVLTQLMKTLEGMRSLKSLAFYFNVMTPDDSQYFLEELSKNRAITALRIDACCFVPGEGKVFEEYLAKNAVLEDLTVEHVNETYNYHTTFNLEPLSRALGKNKTLKKLCLMSFDPQHGRHKLFFDALAKNSTLQHLEVDSLPHWGFRVEMFVDLIEKNTGLLRLYVLSSSGCSVASLAAAISRNATLQKLAIHLSDLTHENAALFLEALASNKSLEWVYIGHVYGPVIPEFCRILQETGTEARVKFCAAIDEPGRLARTLKDCPRLSENHVRLFKTMLEGNLVLRDLSLTSSEDDASLSVLRELPQCLANNYSLLKVSMNKCLRFERCMFQVQDTMRRNLSFLNRAAEFVMGLHSKHSAHAFEHLCQSEALLTKVQELACGTEPDARHKIKESAAYLDINFLAIVGVVKEGVACDRDSVHCAQVQFDQLGVDNWLKIRSYLRVSDIRDREAAESLPDSPPLKQKRKS